MFFICKYENENWPCLFLLAMSERFDARWRSRKQHFVKRSDGGQGRSSWRSGTSDSSIPRHGTSDGGVFSAKKVPFIDTETWDRRERGHHGTENRISPQGGPHQTALRKNHCLAESVSGPTRLGEISCSWTSSEWSLFCFQCLDYETKVKIVFLVCFSQTSD